MNDKIMKMLQKIIDKHNPCDIKVIKGKATCRSGTPCCTGCQFLTKNGCSTRSDACKFYFCSTAWKSLSVSVQNKIKRLGKLYQGLLYQRGNGIPVVNPPFLWNRSGPLQAKHDPINYGYTHIRDCDGFSLGLTKSTN